jgi:hypothetical protein
MLLYLEQCEDLCNDCQKIIPVTFLNMAGKGTHSHIYAFTHTCNTHEHTSPTTHTVNWKQHERNWPNTTSQHYPSIRSEDTLFC